MFGDKSKAVDAEWKIEIFKQNKKHITNFIIEFEMLAIKTETDKLHVIFLLKKNIQMDIIKMILGYPLIAAPKILREQKMVIISVKQEYKSTESKQDYRTETRTTYRERGISMDIEKAKENFNKDRKP